MIIFTIKVKLKNPNIKLKSNENNQFVPWTTRFISIFFLYLYNLIFYFSLYSPFELSINEGSSFIEVSDNDEELKKLVNIPIREHNDFYNLIDVQEFPVENNEIQRDANILFLIRQVIVLFLYEFKFLKIKISFRLDK